MRRNNPDFIGDRTLRNFEFLLSLINCRSAKQRYEIVQNATRDQLLSIVDICSNIMNKKFKLTDKQNRRLAKYKNVMKKLGRSRSEKGALMAIQQGEGIQSKKKDYVIQRGGLLPALVVPVLIELAASGAEYILSRLENK